MATREDVVCEARRFVGTPFEHQGRLLGVGVDCIGIAVSVGKILGLTGGYDANGYGRNPSGNKMLSECAKLVDAKVVDSVPLGEALQLGDLLLMRIFRDPQHVAIVTALNPVYIVHAHQGVGKCVEHRLDDQWRKRIIGVYRYRGLQT